jgi:hypothetical protein
MVIFCNLEIPWAKFQTKSKRQLEVGVCYQRIPLPYWLRDGILTSDL